MIYLRGTGVTVLVRVKIVDVASPGEDLDGDQGAGAVRGRGSRSAASRGFRKAARARTLPRPGMRMGWELVNSGKGAIRESSNDWLGDFAGTLKARAREELLARGCRRLDEQPAMWRNPDDLESLLRISERVELAKPHDKRLLRPFQTSPVCAAGPSEFLTRPRNPSSTKNVFGPLGLGGQPQSGVHQTVIRRRSGWTGLEP
ncbi:hypothetical protein CMUS01_13490 [Colletotrichum musicola]|uniref:Uncharacterized protein n=1 Tax=Colletotrichum musicola TaxID=2175873 RepID=A0A8H6JC44_9PEZI|nr:hypothetical protein CMUS01_13490 [Colletotrichum musicola]